LEDLYDLKDRFKKSTNSKLQSSTLRFELINLGIDFKPKNLNLSLDLTSNEILAFIHSLKKYKIIQHTIPMIFDKKPVQQKLRKIHSNLENQIKPELNKLLKAKIIFPVRHSSWFSNLVQVRKKNGDIRIYIDFRNLKKAC